jgi:hypothetical protein
MIQKEREIKPPGLSIEKVGETKILVPEYPSVFFEDDWQLMLDTFTNFLFELDYQRRNHKKKGLSSSPTRTFVIGQKMYYLVEDVNEGVIGEVRCAPIVSKTNTMLPELKYSRKDHSIELAAEFEPSDLFSGTFKREEIYYPDEGIKSFVKKDLSRIIEVPRLGLDLPIPNANDFDHIHLAYYYDLEEDDELPAEISLHMRNKPLKPDLDNVNEEGELIGESNWLDDIYVFRDIELVDGRILIRLDNNTEVPSLVQELIRLLTNRTTGKDLRFEANG